MSDRERGGGKEAIALIGRRFGRIIRAVAIMWATVGCGGGGKLGLFYDLNIIKGQPRTMTCFHVGSARISTKLSPFIKSNMCGGTHTHVHQLGVTF